MSRLPTPGDDENTWGDILNDFLSVEHNNDGTLKKAGVITGAEQSVNKGQPNGYAPLDGTGKVPNINLNLGNSATRNVGTTAGTVAAGDDTRFTPSTPAPAVLAVKAYLPGADVNTSQTSSTYVDIDATNVLITFTATSTAVLVLVQACFQASFNSTSATTIPGVVGLREGSTTVAELHPENNSAYVARTVMFYVSGLTIGSTHTYKLATHSDGSVGLRTAYGPSFGPVIMTAIAA